MCRIRLLLVEMGIWLGDFSGADGSDGTGDGGDGEGDRTASKDVARDVLYMLKYLHFNSGNVRYAPSIDRDGCLAGCAPGWGWR
jgi:hypothetical protein